MVCHVVLAPAWHEELSLIETRLHHLVEAIANGKASDVVFNSITEVEARKKVVVQEPSMRDSLDQIVNMNAKRLAKELRSRLGDIPALFARHVPQARQMLRKLLETDTLLVNRLWKGGRRGIVSWQQERLPVYSQE